MAERQKQVAESGARVARGLFFAAKLGASAVAAAGREAKKAYDEKREQERRGQGQNRDVPTAVAYPVNP